MKKIRSMIVFVCLMSVLLWINIAIADILDTGNMYVYASGSLNDITGGGSIDSMLLLPEGSTFDYFTLKLTQFSSSGNLNYPAQIMLSFLYKNDSGVVTLGSYVDFRNPYIGQTLTIPGSWASSYALQMMKGFISDSNVRTPEIRTDMHWNYGGVDGSANAVFEFSAHGTAPPVIPEPVSSTLFVVGGSLLAGRSYLKRRRKA